MPGISETSSATNRYVMLDWNEFVLQGSVAGRRATLVRLAAEAREREDNVSLQRIQANMQQLEAERQQLEAELQRLRAAEVALASQSMMNMPGGYMPPAPVLIQQQPQPSMTGNVLQVPHVPQPPAPSNVIPPMPMASGAGPVPGPAPQGPNSVPTPYEEERAKRKRNRRSDRGQPKPRRPRKSASSSESASQRRGTQSPAHTQGPVGQAIATLPPSSEGTSGEEWRWDSLLQEHTPAVVQGSVPDNLLDPALRAEGSSVQPFAELPIATQPANPDALLRDLAWLNDQQEGSQHTQGASNFVPPYLGSDPAGPLQVGPDFFAQQQEPAQQSVSASNSEVGPGDDLHVPLQPIGQQLFAFGLDLADDPPMTEAEYQAWINNTDEASGSHMDPQQS